MALEAPLQAAGDQASLSALNMNGITVESKENPSQQSFPSAPPTINRLVHDVFQEQVAAHPNAPAISSWDGYFTYKQLDDLSSRLAVRLLSHGVEPDVIVPILCEKSAITIICILAVCKAGGAFTALDTSHPDERLKEIIHDTKATLLLASPSQKSRFVDISNISVTEVSVDIVSQFDALSSSLTKLSNVSPSNLLYIIFTSGSTGRPKGVMIEHRAFVTSALAYGADQGINQKSRIMQFASYAFDMSLMEILTTLMFGGCLCVPTDEERFGGIPNFVNRTGVNTVMLTPSYAKLLDPSTMPSLKSFITGGEAAPSDLLKRWSAHVDVYIAYGPTEASIQAAGTKFKPNHTDDKAEAGLIGYPTGCNVWVVKEDDHSQLVPPGETGELLVEGHTLARGYLGDDLKTREAFVEFSTGSETRRAYKTGDLVRQTSSGSLIFVGRKDTQVKVQGIRFELTEIETRLSESHLLPSGSHVCVEKVDIPSTNQAMLATFISASVKNAGSQLPRVQWSEVEGTLEIVPKLRESLSKVLPAPLIPSVYVPVDFIPLASSAKTDRKALKQLVKELGHDEFQRLQKSNSSQEASRPLSVNEGVIRELWAVVLNRAPETITPNDNFIHLGGDSVTSIKLVSAARERGINLTSPIILSSPILSDMTEKAQFQTPSAEATKIEPFGLLEDSPAELRATAAALCRVGSEAIEDVLPMTVNQMRWYGKTLMKPDAWLDQHHFRLPPDVDLGRLQSALNSTVEAAELLRARVIPNPSRKLLQAILEYKPIELVTLNTSLEAYLKQDIENSMGLGRPLSRYAIVGDESSKIFVWTIHHAIYDGYSLSMLLHTIDQFYDGLKPAPFTPFNRYVKGPSIQVLDQSQQFWTEYLAGSSWAKFPDLPSAEKKLAPSMESFLTTMNIPPQPQKPQGSASITTANCVRVAYASALSSYSSDESSVLFLESLGGRNSTFPGIERVAGPTLLTNPTRLYLSSSKTCRQVLEEAQNSFVERMKFQDFPIMRLLPLAPPLELRNLLMIEDDAFLLTENSDRLFGKGASELNLDESDAMPMLVRCNIRKGEIDIDVRYDSNVIQEEGIRGFTASLERLFKEFVAGDQERTLDSILAL